jgi:hypothetical protein
MPLLVEMILALIPFNVECVFVALHSSSSLDYSPDSSPALLKSVAFILKQDCWHRSFNQCGVEMLLQNTI